MIEFYLQGVLVAYILSACKVLSNLHVFEGRTIKAIVLGCLIFSIPSWIRVVNILYWECKRW